MIFRRIRDAFISFTVLLIVLFSTTAVASNPDRIDLPESNDPSLADVASATDLSAPDTLSGWTMSWSAALTGSQAAYSNWSRGGVNTLSANSSSLITLLYRQDEFIYQMRLRNRYGQARIEDRGVRKTDDLISVRNRFLYSLGNGDDEFKLFGNVNFETQFTEGFNYESGPEGEDVLISDFLSPAYFTQNTGVAYYPDADFSVELGLGLKQTIVRDTTLSTRYGLDEGSVFRSEAGVTFGLNFESQIMDNIYYLGYLETFSNLMQPIRRTDFRVTNEVIGEVNEYVKVSFRLDMIYNDDISNRLQVAQVLSAGIKVDIN